VTSTPEPPLAETPIDSAPPASGKRPVRVWDIVVTVLLLLALVGLTLIVSMFGLYLSVAADACGARACDTGLIAIGMVFATVVPWMLLGIAVIASIVLLILRRLAFWVPLVCAVLMIISFFIGGGLATAGVPPV